MSSKVVLRTSYQHNESISTRKHSFEASEYENLDDDDHEDDDDDDIKADPLPSTPQNNSSTDSQENGNGPPIFAHRASVIRKASLEGCVAPTFFNRRESGRDSIGYDKHDSFPPDEVAYWLPPPPSIIQKTPVGRVLLLEADEDTPITVDFRCACFRLSNISTVDFSTIIKFVVVFEWNDPRLCALPMTTNDLPTDLWGPDIIMENAQIGCEIVYDSFALLESETGRLKRTITFHGPVYNPMDLEDFPFDIDDLEMKFVSICNWRTLDGSRFGNDPNQRVYVLKPMLDRKKHKADFFFLGWGGKVNEFSILGWSLDVQNYEDAPSRPISFTFDIHLVRKTQFYYLKILLPLWLLVLMCLAPYGIETDDLQGRLEVLVTLLLSTIAFLYIIQESVPKISHLTVIDKVVIVSLVSQMLAVLFSFIVSIAPNPETLNWILAVLNQTLYWIANLFLVGIPHYRYKQYIADMANRQITKELTSSGKLKPSLLEMDSWKGKSKFDNYSPGQKTIHKGMKKRSTLSMIGSVHSHDVDLSKCQQEDIVSQVSDSTSQMESSRKLSESRK